MATYRYLGYGITNEQGIAKLDHDANNDPIDHSYTGTGAGELDIIASLDNDIDISDSSIQSETYIVWDTLFHDVDSTGNDNSKWIYSNANTILSALDDGKLIDFSSQSSGNTICGCNGTSGTTWDWNNLQKFNYPFAVEFDIVSVSNNAYIMFYVGGVAIKTFAQIGASANSNVKIFVENNKVYSQVDTGAKTELASITSASTYSFAFRVNAGHYFKFANFKAYSI